ncbi:MAG: peptidoglycan editing factor PgeF [Lautropia mirabilis]|nr:peptidoglycan editing factor PgeF [Lautropia mirabilis]
MTISLNDDHAFLPMPPAPHPSLGWTFTLRSGGVSQGPWGAGADSTDDAPRDDATPAASDGQAPRQEKASPKAPSPASAASGSTGSAPGGLNLGIHCGDDPAAAHENRRRVQAIIGQPISWLKQVHGIRVLDLDEAHPDTDASRGTNRHAPSQEPQTHVQGTSAGADMIPATDPPVPEPEADAQITTRPGIALAVQVADCLPVLLADRQGRVIGAAHAGWRSLAGGILQATVQKMRQKVPDADIVAWLGPCIGPAVFEVGDEVRDAFIAAAQDMATNQQGRPPEQEDAQYTTRAEPAFQPGRKPGKWLANLPELARQHLHALGITDIHTAGACTFSDPARFWSYRRDQTCGRMAGLVWIKP